MNLRWEYLFMEFVADFTKSTGWVRTARIWWPGTDEAEERSDPDAGAILNEAGSAGWELVDRVVLGNQAFVQSVDTGGQYVPAFSSAKRTSYLFKRPIA